MNYRYVLIKEQFLLNEFYDIKIHSEAVIKKENNLRNFKF